MKRLILAVIVGLANFAFGAVGYEFYTGGAVSWIQTGDVWRSGAIDSSMTPDEEDSGRIISWLELTVDGPCTVSFDSKLLPVAANSYWSPNCELWVDGESQSWQHGYEKASRQSVDVCGGGVHVIRWEVYTYSYWGEDSHSPIEISNVQIQDAPANVTVRFDANGGSVGVSERTFSTSAANYGDLPVPTRGACEFLGWFTAKLGGTRVDGSSGVRFNASVLYAQWSIPLKQAVGGGESVGVSAGDWGEPWNQWHGVPDEAHDSMGAAFGGKNAGSLYIQTSAKGTLSFWWKAKSGGVGYLYDVSNGGWSQVARVEPQSTWSQSAQKSEYSDSDWQQMVIPVSHGGGGRYEVQAGWYSGAGEECGVLVDEISWTPAPDSVTVSFDANGGRVSAQPMTFDTNGYYEGLPTPTRDGWDFDGWFTAPVGGWRVENGGEVRFEATTLYAHWSIPLDEALGTDLEVWSDQMENSDDFSWYGNPEIETPVGSGAACVRRGGQTSWSGLLHAPLGGMGTISFWWKTKGDAYGHFRGGDGKGTTKSISSGMSAINPETGLFEYLDSKWQQVTIDCHAADEVYWEASLYDDAADLYVSGLTWTPAPESMEVQFMTGKNVIGKKETYVPGDTFWGCCGRGHPSYEPTRSGYVFGGWYYDVDFTREVNGDDPVPFAGAKVYAKWFRTLASAETPLKFRNNPGACEDEFYALLGYEAVDWEFVERTYTDGEEAMRASFGNLDYGYYYAVLETTITGSAFLDFVWGFSSGLGSLSLYVDGKERARYSPSFDVGAMLAGDVTTLPNESVRVVLDEGTHTVRWEASGSGTAAIVDDVATSAIVPTKTIGEWLTRFRKLGCWTPDNLSGLESTYATAKKSTTPAVRYKAAIEHALTTVLELGGDELVSDTLSQFGFTMHWLNFGVTGSFDYSNPPVLNALVDEAFAKAKASAETALADLDLIPSTWSGTVTLSASEYPVDEDTAIDYGDVLYLKSMLKGVLGAASWVKAYNVEMDWERLEDDLAGVRIPAVSAQPSLTGDANWGDPVDFGKGELASYDLESIESYLFDDGKTVLKEGGSGTAGSFRTAWYGDKLYLRVAKSEFIADPEDASGDFGISIDLSNGSMQETRSESLGISFAGSDWKSLQEMGLPIDGPWFAESDITDGGWYPVEYQENANDYVWIVDFGVGKDKTNEIVSDTTLRFIDELDVSSGNYYALFFGEMSEAKEATVSYSKHSKAASAAANQRKAFDRVRDSAALANSESLVREALKLAQSADSYIVSKRTHDGVCLFNYDLADEVQLQAMREHVATALASLDAVQSVDWRKGLRDCTIAKLESGELKFGCVDNPMNVYLGALFGGRFTQGLIPPSVRESAYAPDLNAMNSPTLAGLLPDMTRETWGEYLEAFGLAYQYEPIEVPTYGPWGESEAVKNPDKLGPTMLTDMTLEVNGMPGAVGDVVAVFRGDTGALCGLGKVMDDSGTLTVVCYAPKGVKLSFKVWIAESDTTVNCRGCDLTAPESGAFHSGHALSASTAGLSATLVPGEKMDYDTGLVGYTASGLPSGLAYGKTTGKITGAATKPGEYAVKFTKNGAEAEEMTVVVAAVPTVTVAMAGVESASDTNGCKVTGSGAYPVGKTVTLKATAPKGTAFMGYYRAGEPWPNADDYKKTLLTYVMGREDVALVAKFKKEVMTVGCSWLSGGTFTAGVAASAAGIPLDITTESGIKSVSVTKLPTGMTYDSKNKLITGFPNKAGTYTVEIAVTANSGSVEKQTIPLTVEALPAWAVGNFEGTVRCADGTHGTATLSVTAAGKISGKVVAYGQTWTFAANSFAVTSVARGLEQDYAVLADAKCGKETRSVELHVTGRALEGVAANAALVTGALEKSTEIELWRNVWKDADAKGVVAGIAGKYTYFLADGTPLPLDLKSTAVLSGRANVPARGNASVAFSTTVFASSNGVEAAFFVAPDARKGYGEIYERFRIIPESGEREPGVAHRNPGVVAVPEPYKDDSGSGKVTVSPAGGQVDAGKTVTVSASPDAKSVFVKWRYEVGGTTLYSEMSKLTLAMDGEHDVFAYAIFRSKGSFAEPVVMVENSEQAKFKALALGVRFSAFVTVTDEENMKPVKWSAANLPTGLKINVETGEISGVATAVNSKPVVITATSVADPQKRTTFTLDIGGADGKPAALPETVLGTFAGFVNNGTDNLGTFTFTATDKGALSAKVVDAKGTVSFSGSGFAWSKDGKYGVELKTAKGEKLTLTLDSAAGWDKDQLTGSYSSASALLGVSAQRNAFSKAWYFAATGDETTGWTFSFTTDAKAAALTVSLKADGTTSVAGTLGAFRVSASGVANAAMMREGAMAADFAPVLTVGRVKKVLAIRTNLWFDRSNEHIGKEGEGVGEAKFVE